jgi:2-polyprenyl-3-methyl-5-hydroxy-6-metoxy-1,4-benzoquinol methylase
MGNYESENYLVGGGYDIWAEHASVGIFHSYQRYINGHVLDVGCNTGGITRWLTNNNQVKAITGVDINPEAKLKFEEKFAFVDGVSVKFVCANLAHTPMNQDTYDTVVSMHTLEHVWPQDVESFLKNCIVNLKSGGNFVICIPYMHQYKDDHHREFYDEQKLSSVMGNVGLKTVECFQDARWKENHLLTGLFVKP